MHEVLVNRLGGLSLPRKSVVRLTDRPDMFTVDVKQKYNQPNRITKLAACSMLSMFTCNDRLNSVDHGTDRAVQAGPKRDCSLLTNSNKVVFRMTWLIIQVK